MFRVKVGTGRFAGIEIRQTLYVAKEQVPDGFQYDSAAHVSRLVEPGGRLVTDNGSLDTDPALREIAIPLATGRWRAGLYYFEVDLYGGDKKPVDVRHVAIKVRAADDRLQTTVSESRPLCQRAQHPDRFIWTARGLLFTGAYVSEDAGTTWEQRKTGANCVGGTQLRDGTVLGLGYETTPINGKPGWYRGERFVARQGAATLEGPLPTDYYVPQAKPAEGHSLHRGPLFMRSIVERPDKTLVALMAGWFVGDDTPCPYNVKRPYSRAYTCESSDGGRTWKYLTTIGYEHIGSEGYNEGSMKLLPDGRLMVVLRTGNANDPACQDNPIMISESSDGGRTWSQPRRSGVQGAFPDLLVLSDGMLALSYGRPGASIMFSRDLGKTWTDHTVVDATPNSGYTTICQTASGEILMLFGAQGYFDARTNERGNSLQLARIRYKVNAAGDSHAE